MSERKAQAFWAPSGATLRLPPRMRLAESERERLWKGLERFVNCGDDLADYEALGRAFPDFWPIEIWHYPNQEGPAGFYSKALGTIRVASKDELSEVDLKEMDRMSRTDRLNWHPACHKLFLFYRDTLREIWRGERPTRRSDDERPVLADLANPSPLGWLSGFAHEFLLGLMDYNEQALNGEFNLGIVRPLALDRVWHEIRGRFPTVAVEGRVEIRVLWEMGDFSFVPQNDFQRAFYLLFRQNWRARMCPRCELFFVARKPKQIFCGTGCSAGNRLASKREWWNRVGAKRRVKQHQEISRKDRRERKNR